MDKPLVAVFMVTYNHEKYIGQAIESVLMQKTSFTVKLLIGEDCSTDKTQEICNKYKNQNPEKIELLLNKVNIGGIYNALQIYQACFSSGAKYTAMLEGDDYWTDPYKLQKQVDFLEANEDFAICFHDTFELNKENPYDNCYYCSNFTNEVFEFKDLLYRNFIPTCSTVFRNYINVRNIPKWFNKSPAGDWVLHLLNATHGKIKFINEAMGVHRIHSTGIWSKNSQIKNLNSIISIYTLLYKNLKEIKSFKYDYKKGKSNIYKSLEYEYSNNRKCLKSIISGLKYLKADPDCSIFNIKSILKLFYYTFKKVISGNQHLIINKNTEHINVGLSFIQNTNFEFRKPSKKKKYVTIGNNCLINCNFIFEEEGGEVFLGDNVFIGSSNIVCRNKISIGNNIFIAEGCYINDHDSHSVDFNKRREDILQKLKDFRTGQSNYINSKNGGMINRDSITIKDDVWIGLNVSILKGVTIGEGAIVTTCSVVTLDVPPWTIVTGNPAIVVKELPHELRKHFYEAT